MCSDKLLFHHSNIPGHGCGLKYAHVHHAIDRANDLIEFCTYITFGDTWALLMGREMDEEFVFTLN